MNKEYYQKVYEGVLGKVIGVYLGRPFEGWLNEKIEATFGEIDRFVADEMNKPLVVSDDDISGTLVFFKTLVDSGRYENAEYIDFADNWLNYLIEHETVLWWGGYGVSTEQSEKLIVVPAGHLFVLGDNRNAGEDSHVWGFLDQNLILGRAWMKWYPALERFEPPQY